MSATAAAVDDLHPVGSSGLALTTTSNSPMPSDLDRDSVTRSLDAIAASDVLASNTQLLKCILASQARMMEKVEKLERQCLVMMGGTRAICDDSDSDDNENAATVAATAPAAAVAAAVTTSAAVNAVQLKQF